MSELKEFLKTTTCEALASTSASRKPTSERDPRINPIPGDVLVRGRFTRRVTSIGRDSLGLIRSVRTVECVGRLVWPSLHQWRKWAATAQVVKKAEG